jgi:hypothetical protein
LNREARVDIGDKSPHIPGKNLGKLMQTNQSGGKIVIPNVATKQNEKIVLRLGAIQQRLNNNKVSSCV